MQNMHKQMRIDSYDFPRILMGGGSTIVFHGPPTSGILPWVSSIYFQKSSKGRQHPAGMSQAFQLAQKQGLIGTSSHRVFTFNDGFIRMDTLTPNSKLSRLTLCDLIKTSLLKMLNLKGSNIEEWEESAHTTCLNPKVMRGEGMLKVCMLQFMSL